MIVFNAVSSGVLAFAVIVTVAHNMGSLTPDVMAIAAGAGSVVLNLHLIGSHICAAIRESRP